jgi:hypothetical protein
LFLRAIHSAVIIRDDCLDIAAKENPPRKPAKNPPREKAGGRYATGLLLQLPAREVRFRCDSMPKV